MIKHKYLIFNSGKDNCDVFTKISGICLNFGQDFHTAPYFNDVYILRLKSFQHTSHYLPRWNCKLHKKIKKKTTTLEKRTAGSKSEEAISSVLSVCVMRKISI